MATSDKGQILQAMGIALEGNIAGFIVESIAYGIFLYLFFQSTLIFMHRGLRTWPTRVMFITSLVTLLLEGIHMITFIIGLFYSVKAAVLGDPSTIGDRSRVLALRNKIFPLIVVENWVDQFLIYISDGIVIWRAWVLFTWQKWMMILPVALFLGMIATGLGYLATINTLAKFFAVQAKQPILPWKLVTANLALSFIMNVVATLLIAYRLWAHRKLVGIKRFRPSSRSAAQNVLVMLVESGIVYCAVQLVRMVLYCVPSSANMQSAQFYIALVMTSLASAATAMYPTVVIMFVNQQRTIIECFGLDDTLGRPTGDAEYRAATPGHISFALPSSPTETRNESLGPDLSELIATKKGDAARGDIEKALFIENEQTKTAPF